MKTGGCRQIGRGLFRQKPKAYQSGFTIVETMIVLAVSGIMLTSVIALIGGKQDKTEFSQAINEVVSQLQQEAHNVAIGYYPDANDIQCTPAGAGVNVSVITNTVQQGSNTGCTFLGKVLQFGLSANGSGNAKYNAFILAGCQYDGCGSSATGAPAQTLAGAKALLVYPAPGHGTMAPLNESQALENGLQLVKLCYYTSGDVAAGTSWPSCPHQSTSFAVLQSQATYSQGGTTCVSVCAGSQQFSLFGIDHMPVGNQSDGQLATDLASAVDAVGNNYPSNPSNSTPFVAASRVQICLESGTTNQSGLVTVDGEGGSVSVQIKDGQTC